MKQLMNRKSMLSLSIALALVVGFAGGMFMRTTSSHAAALPYKNLQAFVNYMNAHHKAPFDRDGAAIPPGGASSAVKQAANYSGNSGGGTNVKVNQDRNPWPKAELGQATDPTNSQNWVVMANDFRENFDHQFYHVSTNGGATWTDDSMVGGSDPVTGFVPLTFQSDPGVAYDSVGNGYLSTISGNQIFDGNSGYENLDTEIEVTQLFSHGHYSSLLPTSIDDQACDGLISAFSCPAQLDKPLITIDNVPGSPNKGSIYVYYTLFCNGTGPAANGPCTDGTATIPAFSSAILVSVSAGAGLPFSTPALVSGSLTQEQFSSMVIDSHGTPHIFFDDFSSSASINMYESTLSGGSWQVIATPVASFTFNGLNNLNWGFRSNGAVAPGCAGATSEAISTTVAYCAFSAQQIIGGKAESTPSVYLAKVNLATGASTITRVNNDAFGNSKAHFFAWATLTKNGVYVGWYDDRSDPFNTKVNYFVGKSTDGGATFPQQKAVNTVAFNPCVGFPGCGFFGDYTQLSSGTDGVVHAAWSDTRDGKSMQIYSQAITW